MTLALLGLGYQQLFRESGDPTWLSRAGVALRKGRDGAPSDPDRGHRSRTARRHAASLQRRCNPRSGRVAARPGKRRRAWRPRRRPLQPRSLRRRRSLSTIGSRLRDRASLHMRASHSRASSKAGASQRSTQWSSRSKPDPESPSRRPGRRCSTATCCSASAGSRQRRTPTALLVLCLPATCTRTPGSHALTLLGDATRRSAERLQAVIERLPAPQYAILLTDVLRKAGRSPEAARADRLVDALERLLAANGVRTELSTAIHDLDRGVRVGDALKRARAAYAAAPNVGAADAIAWGLYRTGRCGEARVWASRAGRLGTQDALFSFHRAMIERCLGNDAAARSGFRQALRIDPTFSYRWNSVARRYAS